MDSKELSHFIANLSLEKKAVDVIIMDLRTLTSITDYFIICSGDSDVQVKAISEHIVEELAKQRIKIWHVEGQQSLNWILMDLVDVVIHIFKPEVREFYQLERLWRDDALVEWQGDASQPA